MPLSDDHAGPRRLRFAAAGDVHCGEGRDEDIIASLASLDGTVDLVLFAGDLTANGEPKQAAVLARACAQLDVPVFAVLGNHDWHGGRHDELVAALREAGITVLERDWVTCRVAGAEIGIVGVKGFVGGFSGSHLLDVGEPALRDIYAETSREVEALDRGLRAVALCPTRIVLMHYAPCEATIQGEPPGIWAFLGTDRLAAPIAEHEPDVVLHGHAHAGTFAGAIGRVPVYNVSVPVMGRDFWRFELEIAAARSPTGETR